MCLLLGLRSLRTIAVPGFRTHRLTQTEVALCAADVAAYLFAESFGVGPAYLGAEALEEGEVEWGVFGEVDGVEVEQVGFDGEGMSALCRRWAVADVGDGFEGFGDRAGADGEGGDVDAVGGEEFGVGGEVDGGDGVAGAVAAAGGGVADDGEGWPRRARAWLTSPAAMSWRMRLEEMGPPRRSAGGVDVDGEAELAAEGFEGFDAGFGLVAEAEVFAFVELVDLQASQRISVAKSRAVASRTVR